ncbi:MAG TPA: hypothetical protein VD929_06155 [Caulobacteraceae bacterium]|nr:hypothetical protein [Caulobacteraceae bacterium]
MRMPEAARSADHGGGPVWAKANRSGGGGSPFAFIGLLLGLIGALTIGLAVWKGSFAAGGATIDGWISPVTGQIGKLTGGAKKDEAEVVQTAAAAPAPAEAVAAASQAAADAAQPAKK